MLDIADTFLKELDLATRIISDSKTFKHIIIPEFDCSLLPGIETDGKELPEDLKFSIFSHIHQFDQVEGDINNFPCIYVFELIKKSDCERLRQAYWLVDQVKIKRKLPIMNVDSSNDSNYLYVGKAEKTGVGRRLVTHLGYHQKPGNHGLQIAYWIKDLIPAVKIRIHVFRFEKQFGPYVSSFEKIMAERLKPIMGKHR